MHLVVLEVLHFECTNCQIAFDVNLASERYRHDSLRRNYVQKVRPSVPPALQLTLAHWKCRLPFVWSQTISWIWKNSEKKVCRLWWTDYGYIYLSRGLVRTDELTHSVLNSGGAQLRVEDDEWKWTVNYIASIRVYTWPIQCVSRRTTVRFQPSPSTFSWVPICHCRPHSAHIHRPITKLNLCALFASETKTEKTECASVGRLNAL